MPVIDYVVAHELSHLRVMDHSPRFWDTVRTVVPDYAQLRGQLKERGAAALVSSRLRLTGSGRRAKR